LCVFLLFFLVGSINPKSIQASYWTGQYTCGIWGNYEKTSCNCNTTTPHVCADEYGNLIKQSCINFNPDGCDCQDGCRIVNPSPPPGYSCTGECTAMTYCDNGTAEGTCPSGQLCCRPTQENGADYVNCSGLNITGSKDASGNLIIGNTYNISASNDFLGKTGYKTLEIVSGTTGCNTVTRDIVPSDTNPYSYNWTPAIPGTYSIFCGTYAVGYQTCFGYGDCVASYLGNYVCGGPEASKTVTVVTPPPAPIYSCQRCSVINGCEYTSFTTNNSVCNSSTVPIEGSIVIRETDCGCPEISAGNNIRCSNECPRCQISSSAVCNLAGNQITTNWTINSYNFAINQTEGRFNQSPMLDWPLGVGDQSLNWGIGTTYTSYSQVANITPGVDYSTSVAIYKDTPNTYRNNYICKSTSAILNCVPRTCQVTTTLSAVSVNVGAASVLITATVNPEGLGTATVTRMDFGAYNSGGTIIGNVSTFLYNNRLDGFSTTAIGVPPGDTAIWATATLSDGRICQTNGAAALSSSDNASDVGENYAGVISGYSSSGNILIKFMGVRRLETGAVPPDNILQFPR